MSVSRVSRADRSTGQTYEQRVQKNYDRAVQVPPERRTRRQQRYIDGLTRRLHFIKSEPRGWVTKHRRTPKTFQQS